MKKNSNKISGILFLTASICYFISAIFYFISKEIMAVINLCLGACFLCLSLTHFNKDKKNKKWYKLKLKEGMIMKKKKILYISLIIISILLIVMAMTILGNTKLIAPITIVISIYLFIGSLIKLCKMNDKLKNTIICALDLLFWLP